MFPALVSSGGEMADFRERGGQVSFGLSIEERDLVLRFAEEHDIKLADRLRFGLLKGKRLKFIFGAEEFESLLSVVASGEEKASTRKSRRQLSRIRARLRHSLEENDSESLTANRGRVSSGGSCQSEFG